MVSVIEQAKKAKLAAGFLSRLSTEKKSAALLEMAAQVKQNSKVILEANQKDLDAAKVQVRTGKLSEALYSRLKLDETKVRDIAIGIEQVANLEDPVGKVLMGVELDEGLPLYRVTCPIGVIGVIFEARPEALPQIASLALKSGNAVLLKGGSEAEHSNRALFQILHRVIVSSGISENALILLESREDVNALLKAQGFVDLIIPRGSNALVSTIQKNTSIPVLGHAEGICHVYIDKSADLEKALAVTVDAKVQYPAACNAMETLLVHRDIAPDAIPLLLKALQDKGVKLRCDAAAKQAFGQNDVALATEEDWRTEYSDLVLSVKVVSSLEDAIRHINTYGSHHTDSIVTEDKSAFDRFFSEVDSAGVFWNASTRFSDGFRYGFGAEVGISTGKLHPRGPVGLEGLVTYKYKLLGQGKGHTVAPYSGPKARPFTHKPLF